MVGYFVGYLAGHFVGHLVGHQARDGISQPRDERQAKRDKRRQREKTAKREQKQPGPGKGNRHHAHPSTGDKGNRDHAQPTTENKAHQRQQNQPRRRKRTKTRPKERAIHSEKNTARSKATKRGSTSGEVLRKQAAENGGFRKANRRCGEVKGYLPVCWPRASRRSCSLLKHHAVKNGL